MLASYAGLRNFSYRGRSRRHKGVRGMGRKRMNIAILIPALRGGGAERQAQILGNYYVEMGYQVYYFLQDNYIEQAYHVKGKIINTGIKSCMEGEHGDVYRMLRLIGASLQMRALKRRYRIDAAVSFLEEMNYINVLSRGREKVIVRICTILSKRKELTGFLYRKGIVGLFYSMADRAVVMSRCAVQDMSGHYGVPEEKLVKIPNMVMPPKNGEDSGQKWEYGEKVIVCMGRLEAVKQQDRIIRAFSYVAKRDEKARLLLLGKGPDIKYLRRLCVEWQIEDKIRFIGFTDQTTWYLSHARMFVMASRVEGFPNSMIEAMSCAVPVITTDSPGACGEIVGKPNENKKITGLTFCKYGILTPDMPDGREEKKTSLLEEEMVLGEAMLRVLEDDAVYQKYRERSLWCAQMYSRDRVVERWNRLICGKPRLSGGITEGIGGLENEQGRDGFVMGRDG